MIIVKFQGRLGNQMFQYAFALSTAQKLGTFFLMDKLRKSTLFEYFDTKYFFPSEEFNDFLVRNIRKILRQKVIQINTDEVQEFKGRIKNNQYYQGYFQSGSYFSNVPDLMKNRFTIREKYQNEFLSKYGSLFRQNKVLAIHCRLGDYLNWSNQELGGKDFALPQSYYRNAWRKIENIHEYKTIVVTDDPENIKGKFDFIPEKIIVSESEIVDFQILQNANQLITSNSSFSWWAAYLNKKSATIYAPEYWLGFKIKKVYPCSILPENWVRVSCEG